MRAQRILLTRLLSVIAAFCQMASKTFACALGSVENTNVLVLYLVGEFALAIIFKAVRRDFSYWVPIESLPLKIFVGFLTRLGMKVCIDFTGLLQGRHAYEFGGAYFSFTLLSTPLAALYFSSRYLDIVKDEGVQESLEYVLSSSEVYGAVGGLIVLQLLSFSTFLALIDERYRATFTSFAKGSTCCCQLFRDNSHDHIKILIFEGEPRRKATDAEKTTLTLDVYKIKTTNRCGFQ